MLLEISNPYFLYLVSLDVQVFVTTAIMLSLSCNIQQNVVKFNNQAIDPFVKNKQMPLSLSQLTPIIFNVELTHLGSEVFNYRVLVQKQTYLISFLCIVTQTYSLKLAQLKNLIYVKLNSSTYLRVFIFIFTYIYTKLVTHSLFWHSKKNNLI